MLNQYSNNKLLAIDLSTLLVPSEICQIMKANKIRSYVYAMVWRQKELLKYGVSGDHSRAHGERIYRQAGHLDGWGTAELIGSSGSDMLSIRKKFQNKHGMDIDRDDVTIHVIDMTTCADPKSECQLLENYLIEQYIKNHGSPPIGNNDPKTRSIVNRRAVQAQWDRFFENAD